MKLVISLKLVPLGTGTFYRRINTGIARIIMLRIASEPDR